MSESPSILDRVELMEASIKELERNDRSVTYLRALCGILIEYLKQYCGCTEEILEKIKKQLNNEVKAMMAEIQFSELLAKHNSKGDKT